MWYVNEIVCSLNTKLLGFSNSLYIWSQYAFWSVRQMYMVKSQVKLKSIYVLLSWQCTWAALLKISHCLPLGIAILVLVFFSHFEFAGFGWLQEILYPLWNSCHLVLEMMEQVYLKVWRRPSSFLEQIEKQFRDQNMSFRFSLSSANWYW